MTNTAMVLQEEFGWLPAYVLAVFRSKNVSPADYFGLEVCLGEGEFQRMVAHIQRNSPRGFYSMPFPFSE